jgi:hypothetical protein
MTILNTVMYVAAGSHYNLIGALFGVFGIVAMDTGENDG